MIPLTTTMQINAISSGATGAGLIALAKPIAGIFGVTQTVPFIFVGAFLVLFATLVFAVSKGKPVNPGAVKFVILLDTLWVAGSALAIVMLFPVISGLGSLLIAGVALWVAAMAWLQKKGLAMINA
ncbi:hypothetical protein [Chitinophaga barathri]|uniref:Uncharacterized protein n=1 Tax=Chitinophaga barathri TaxID=1647451 RepID=A0A3N4MA07_9BACT|nr:hypothetical protein [Chitinophaga barathri]RPD40584.1 hypothetical protein EG028_14895 [Chitinophaga barathri]